MAAYYTGPTMEERQLHPLTFPLSLNFTDLAGNATWTVDTKANIPGEQFYHVLAMKPSALYSDENLYYQVCLRIMLKASQGGLLASLLLLNTYWCKHVEALVDEGNFMSNAEKYLYWVLAVFSLIVPVTTMSVLALGFGDKTRGGNISDLLLLIGGTAVLICYVITCRRLRALERDSRNVNGDDTSVTLQLSYYVYCIYWLIGSMVFIFVIGLMYRFDEEILKPQCNPVKAQIVSDLEGATWNTVLVMVYPAAMFLLYPSVDVLTKPANDPAPHFQKRVRRVVKDAKRFRESLYLDGGLGGNGGGSGDSGSGINGVSPQHSSLHGLSTNSGVALRPIGDNGQAQGQNDQAQQQQHGQQGYSYIEPKRRDRMDSLTAVASEMHMIEQEPSPDGSKQGSWTGANAAIDQDIERGTAYKSKSDNNNNLRAGLSRRDSGSPSNYYEDGRDVETMKKWLAQNGDLDRDSVIAGLEQTIQLDQHQHRSWDYAAPTTAATTIAPPKVTTTPASPDISSTAPRRPSGEHYAMTSTSSSSNNHSASSSKSTGASGKPAGAPLTGILKTRNSTSSTRSSFGQNPFEQQQAVAAANMGMGHTPVYGVRTSSVQPQNQTAAAGSRKSTENMPVKRRASNSGASKSNTAVTGPSPTLMSSTDSSSPSPTSQQQRRSNVTTRMDAGALAIAAHQHQQQQQQQKGRSSRDAMDIDYFGLRKTSFDVHSTATSPAPLPYEPQGQNVPPLDMIMSPTMTGFLMADPPFSMSSANNSRTPPPPTTAPPPRPRHEDTAPLFSPIPPPPSQQQQQQTTTAPSQATSSAIPARHEPQPLFLPELPQRIPITPSSSPPQHRVMTPPAKSPYRVRESFETRMAAHSNYTNPNTYNPTPSTTPTATGTSTAPSSVAGRDAGGGGGGIQGPSASSSPTSAPSVASTTSPTILSATTLPRPLTPAWYETKTNFFSSSTVPGTSSTNDVLNHYNAVTRGGSYHQKQQLMVAEEEKRRIQQQQQQQQSQFQNISPQEQQQPYYMQPSVGPLDE
ncbi:hypothetical protein BGZ97_008856, partial [Linnemannia gamsii]